jgi:hypothetical protein
MMQTPDNAGYFQAAYVAAAAIYLLYALTLWIRARRLREGRDPRHPDRG